MRGFLNRGIVTVLAQPGLVIEIIRAIELLAARATCPAGLAEKLIGAGLFQTTWTTAFITGGTVIQATETAAGTATDAAIRTTGTEVPFTIFAVGAVVVADVITTVVAGSAVPVLERDIGTARVVVC